MLSKRIVSFLCVTVFFAPSIIADITFDVDTELLLDANHYNGAIFSDAEMGDSGSEFYLRRAKLELNASLAKRLAAELSADYDDLDEELQIKNAYLIVEPTKRISLKLGKFKEPAGAERRHALAQQLFLERSIASNAFGFGRNTGVALAYDGKAWLMETAVFQMDAESSAFEDGLAYVIHASANPWRSQSKTAFAHLGASFSRRDNAALRFDIDEPLIAHGLGNIFHSPNYFAADEVKTQSFELMGSYKRIFSQAEFMSQTVRTRNDERYEHGGAYITAAWNVFGDVREYRKGKVRFPKKMRKTFELALRYSYADTANNGKGDDAEVLSVVANYYLNKQLRFALAFEQASLQSVDETLWVKSDGNAINARFQYVY